jgi:hypothetical protein
VLLTLSFLLSRSISNQSIAHSRGYFQPGRKELTATPSDLIPRKGKQPGLLTGAVSDSFQVNDDEIGESRLRENLRSDEGSFSQEYLSERPNL